MVAGSSFFCLPLPSPIPPSHHPPNLPPSLSSWFLSAEQQRELERPFSRHRWYCSLQFSSNPGLEIAWLSQAICSTRWTADSGGGGEKNVEAGAGGMEGTERGEGGNPPLSSFHPAAAHVRCELGAGRGQNGRQFIYRRDPTACHMGGPIC